MLIRSPGIVISDASPFASDKLGRTESAERLTLLLERVKPPFVLAIEGKYGNGKTTFIQMWNAHLKTKGFRSLYFNAWEADFTSDPLIAFIGEMDAEITRLLGDSASTAVPRRVWKEIKEKGAYLTKRAIPVAVKLATAGILDADSFTEQSLANLSGDIAKEQIEKYDATKNAIKDFKKRLGEFIKDVYPSQTSPALPLVFFVDELDRCRPTYAIELLERIKHFFSIEEIVFVLALDKAQLFSSIRSVYGGGLDVDGYLRRFIDLEYSLPSPKTADFLGLSVSHFRINELLSRTNVERYPHNLAQGIEIFRSLAEAFDLSLRVQEQCFARLAVILMTAAPGTIRLSLLVALLALQAKDPALYTGLANGTKTVVEVLDLIATTPKGRAFLLRSEGTLLEAYLLKSRRDREPSVGTRIDNYKASQGAWDPGAPNPNAIRLDRILGLLSSDTFNYDMIEEAATAIAFSRDFTTPAAPTGLTIT